MTVTSPGSITNNATILGRERERERENATIVRFQSRLTSLHVKTKQSIHFQKRSHPFLGHKKIKINNTYNIYIFLYIVFIWSIITRPVNVCLFPCRFITRLDEKQCSTCDHQGTSMSNFSKNIKFFFFNLRNFFFHPVSLKACQFLCGSIMYSFFVGVVLIKKFDINIRIVAFCCFQSIKVRPTFLATNGKAHAKCIKGVLIMHIGRVFIFSIISGKR